MENVTYRNSIIHGDCVEIMRNLPSGCADLICTDPPYIARYRSREGKTLTGDDNARWLEPAFAQMYRLLKSDSFCLSFYGWPKIDLFMRAWRRAGFRVAGHIVFRKRYASKRSFVNYTHEAAFLLIKGNPAFPATPLDDVRDWIYSGNRFHPTQKSIHILRPLIESFSRRGDLVLDPFAGSGSTLKAALLAGRDYCGIELDPAHHATATGRLALTNVRGAA